MTTTHGQSGAHPTMREGNKAETTDDTAESDEASADGSGKQPDDEGETEATAGEAADAEPATAASDDASNEAAAAVDRLPMTATPTLTPTRRH